MNIESIFSKQLTRDINGVVKAEQVDNDSVYVELDEYVPPPSCLRRTGL